MSKQKKDQNSSEQDEIKKKWSRIKSQDALSTKEKLEKLVGLSLKRKEKQKEKKEVTEEFSEDKTLIIRDYSYPVDSLFGNVKLSEWNDISSKDLLVISRDEEFLDVSPMKLLFFDTETTGISGGTGTIPFMLGFGYFEQESFKVKVFILNDLYKEDEFLDEVDRFLEEHDFSATVTYNGKSFDFPLMETRYILYRKRFPLLKKPHLDFLFPARTIWKNTYESRKLGFLGDMLLGIPRDEDIDASQIPMLYFNFLRTRSFSLIEKVVEHNALDVVGLAALLLRGAKYLNDLSYTSDEGEILGTAIIYEKYGDFEKANEIYKLLKKGGERLDIISKAVKRLSVIMKKKKLYNEAAELWEILSGYKDHYAYKELSVHYEHREKNFFKAVEFVEMCLERIDLTDLQKRDLDKRLNRLKRKIEAFENED